MMLTITMPGHILYGSGYPYVGPGMLTKSGARMTDDLTTDTLLARYKDMFLRTNALRLFGEPASLAPGTAVPGSTTTYLTGPDNRSSAIRK